MVLITTAMGFYLASATAFDWMMLLNVLFGTGLLACGAAALNQYLEKDFDAKMPRARIGAVHSIVFGAFSADSLVTRINDSKCKAIITQDTGHHARRHVLKNLRPLPVG